MKDPKRDQDAERLRALLTAAAPSGPDDPNRAQRVAARGRRDRRRAITAGVIGLVAAAVIIVPQVLNTARTSDMRNNVTNQPTTATQQANGSATMTTTPCPDDPPLLPDDVSGAAIPGEAASVRLCVVKLPGSGQATAWNPPVDALTVQTSAFLAAVADLPEADSARCDAIRVTPDPYLLLVGSSGSSAERVFVSNTCQDVALDGVAHESDAVLGAFFDALAQQREAMHLDTSFGLSVSTEAGCGPGTDTSRQLTRGPAVTAETRFEALVACDTFASKEGVADLNSAWPTSTRDLHQVPAEDVDRCPASDVVAPPTYAVTTWGDLVRFEFRACGNYVVGGYALGDDPTDPAVARDMQFLPDAALADELGLP